MKNIWGKLVVFLLILLLLKLFVFDFSKAKEYRELYSDSQIEIVKIKNEYGQELSAKDVIILNNEKDLLRLQTNDSSLKALQNIVKNFEGKLSTAISIVNSSVSSGKTAVNLLGADTIIKEDTVYIYPVYNSSWDNEWDQGQITARRDSVFRYIQIKNKYELTVGRTKHWFKPDETKVKVLNLNPNTLTQEINAVQIQSQQKKLGVSLQFGYGFSSGILPSPYLGIGLGYQLISIR